MLLHPTPCQIQDQLVYTFYPEHDNYKSKTWCRTVFRKKEKMLQPTLLHFWQHNIPVALADREGGAAARFFPLKLHTNFPQCCRIGFWLPLPPFGKSWIRHCVVQYGSVKDPRQNETQFISNTFCLVFNFFIIFFDNNGNVN